MNKRIETHVCKTSVSLSFFLSLSLSPFFFLRDSKQKMSQFLILSFVFVTTFQATKTSFARQVPPFLNTETSIYSFGGTAQTQFSRFAMCKNGRIQSPININEPISLDLDSKLTISNSWKIAPKEVILVNSGHKR